MKIKSLILDIKKVMINMLDIINNLTEFFKNRNINFVIGGGCAINMLGHMFDIDEFFEINNLDVFYMANTPITPQYIHNYRRVQDCPHTSTTYLTEDGFRINLTMIRNDHIRCVKFNNLNNNINIMHPMKLYSYYDDEINPTDIQISKMQYLKYLDTKIPVNFIVMEYKNINNQDDFHNQNVMNEPIARQLFIN